MRIYLKNDVYEQTKKRLEYIFQEFEEVVVWISGGKDSTVLYYMCLEAAKKLNKLPMKVAFIDQEAEWENTIIYMRELMTNPDNLEKKDYEAHISALKNKLEHIEKLNKGFVPVIERPFLTDKEAKEYRIADNKISSLSEWDNDKLMFELRELDKVIGFTTEEINNLLKTEKVKYDAYSKEEIDKETDKINKHFENISSNYDNEDVELICPHCKEEFTMKMHDIKANMKYEKYTKDYGA